jgi:hypothetical protein
MIKDCISNLAEHQELLLKLSDKQYQHQSELLSGASIGQHLRHVVEVQHLEKDLFMSYMLVYTGANAVNGKVLLWKENGTVLNNKVKFNEFYLSKSDLEPEKVEKINQYL